MTQNVVEFPDRSAIEEEAAVWLIKLDDDDPPSASELALLREWLERSPVHREELVGLATFWDKMNVLTELAVPLGNQKSGVKFGFLQACIAQHLVIAVSVSQPPLWCFLLRLQSPCGYARTPTWPATVSMRRPSANS